MADAVEVRMLERSDGPPLAYRLRGGSSPTLCFLPGYASDMDGAKAVALDAFAAERGLAMLRFDYSGTGLSGGAFEDGTLASWIDDTLLVIDRLTRGPVLLIGSSMGGWISLHVAMRRPDRVAAVVGIAAAPDFTEWGYSGEDKDLLVARGRLERANPYGGEPQVTTRAFWESGQQLGLLDAPIDIDVPVRLIHGDADADVPLAIAERVVTQLRSADVQLTVVKGGGHRLSEPHEIATIIAAVAGLLETL